MLSQLSFNQIFAGHNSYAPRFDHKLNKDFLPISKPTDCDRSSVCASVQSKQSLFPIDAKKAVVKHHIDACQAGQVDIRDNQ